MFDTLPANFLIGLREGLEAALIVTILVAFLVRTERRDKLPMVWLGVAGAVVLSVVVGALLSFVWDNVDNFKTQELLGGTLSIVAVGLVTWMIFWMRRTARFLKKELNNKLSIALNVGPAALVGVSFLAVAREGLETTLFFWSATRQSGQTAGPLVQFLLGILVAVILGWLIYRSTVKINLSKFFTYTGIGLILVAAGILAYGIHDLQEIDLLPGLNSRAFDISNVYDISSWYGTLLKGFFNFQPNPSVLQTVVWVGYLVIVLSLFLWPARVTQQKPSPSKEKQLDTASASSAQIQ